MSEARAYEVLGVPSSAGAHHAGQELGPKALRDFGFVDRLREAGADVIDAGDVAGSVFRADPDPVGGARNIAAAIEVAGQVADEVERIVRDGRIPVVIGGDCTVTLGVVAGVQRVQAEVGVAYVDGDADLSVPGVRGNGILDSTVVSHLLGIVDSPLGRLGPSWPPLEEDQIVLLGYNQDDPDSFDDDVLTDDREVLHFSDDHLREVPMEAAGSARTRLDVFEGLVVHFDVDAVDSADLPLADFPHYGTGQTLAGALDVVQFLLSAPNLRALSLTEVNPTHDPSGEQLERYVAGVTAAIAGS
ncbi:arginase [Frondihabitans sp. PhB188]|uniref:arginase family protein n=1 Tax=Frondihabitans sp. PhB188 TaxID=2485200 RepID=UPI000F4ABD21|nr:arginase family protein [Frondihabitans sp. PhB188]ROQ40782.1 arginase [Frondihabitans sp. PhB188]